MRQLESVKSKFRPSALSESSKTFWSRLAVFVTPLLVLLADPRVAMAIDINEDFKPEEEFKLDPWIKLEIGGLDMSINKAVLYIWLASFATIFTMVWVGRRMKDRPNKVQTVVESTYIFTRDTLTRSNISNPQVARRWFGFIATLFLFIWFSNMIGFIPLPTNSMEKVNIFGWEVPSFAIYSATANFSVPIVLTLIVWFSYHIEGIKARGVVGYFKSFIPAGISGPILILVAPIEVLSHFVRLVSLSARLFANMLAGHLLILIMGGGLAVLVGIAVVGVLTLPIAVAFYIFEVGLVATLQAFIFAILSSIYIGGATGESH